MDEKRITLADVAQKAGVHVTTVSRALKNNPRLPAETRDRIRKIAEDLGYAPDPMLGALVAYRAKLQARRDPPTLAYVTNWNSRWGWKQVTAHPDFFQGAEAKAKELGFRLEHFWVREPGLTHERLSRILYSRGITGVVLASHVRECDEALAFDWDCFSGIKIDYVPHRPKLHNVTANHIQIIRLAMQTLLAGGYTRIGLVIDEGWDITVDRLWSAGYVWETGNIPVQDRLPICYLPGKVPVETWLKRHRPQVVVSRSAFVLPALRALGLSVPKDIALVDIFLETLDGSVAGVSQNWPTVGAVAVELLAGHIQQNKRGVPRIPTTTYIEGTWVQGGTCPIPRER